MLCCGKRSHVIHLRGSRVDEVDLCARVQTDACSGVISTVGRRKILSFDFHLPQPEYQMQQA